MLFSGYQSRNTRVKKRAAVSSAWLEKYKPVLPKDSQHSIPHSDDLVGNECESQNIPINDHNSTEKEVDNENNALSPTRQIASSCPSMEEIVHAKESSLNAPMMEEKNKPRKSPENKLRINKVIVPSKSKQREAKKNLDSECLNDDIQQKATDSHQASEKRCLRVSDSFVANNPIVTNTSVEGKDSDASDSPQEVVSNKRKAEGSTTVLEKPCKRFRPESDNKEGIYSENKV